jgi:hypothetical protein
VDIISNLTTVARYLARRDIPELSRDAIHEPIDILVLMPCSLIEPIHIAAGAIKQGTARQLLVSGGLGHSTQALRDVINNHPVYHSIETEGRTEAGIIYDVLTHYLDVPPGLIIVENTSTNCGTNAEESRKVLDARDIAARTLILVQDPTMQRRTQACFERAWSDKPEVKILSFAPFMPRIHQHGDSFSVVGSTENMWPFERFVSLVLGEIPRLKDDENGYGPRGHNFIDHIDIPEAVLAAHTELTKEFRDFMRIAAK